MVVLHNHAHLQLQHWIHRLRAVSDPMRSTLTVERTLHPPNMVQEGPKQQKELLRQSSQTIIDFWCGGDLMGYFSAFEVCRLLCGAHSRHHVDAVYGDTNNLRKRSRRRRAAQGCQRRRHWPFSPCFSLNVCVCFFLFLAREPRRKAQYFDGHGRGLAAARNVDERETPEPSVGTVISFF